MSRANPKTVQALLKAHRIGIKKKYGQNFLIDDNILTKIVDAAALEASDVVVEIGPGLGGLTEHLIKRSSRVIAYEIDKHLIPTLEQHFAGPTFHLIHDDVLKRDIDEDIKQYAGDANDVIVVANLPYYITTPILMRCLESSKRIKRMVVMMQHEVARRITAMPDTKDYNALSIAVQYRAKATYRFKVPKSVFLPAPNVDSAVVRLDFHDKTQLPEDEETFFFAFVRAAFKQRRKTLLNNLTEFLSHEKVEIADMLDTLGIDGTRRAETLSIEDFIRLAAHFKSA